MVGATVLPLSNSADVRVEVKGWQVYWEEYLEYCSWIRRGVHVSLLQNIIIREAKILIFQNSSIIDCDFLQIRQWLCRFGKVYFCWYKSYLNHLLPSFIAFNKLNN